MNITILEYLNNLLKKSRITDLTIERGGTRIYINRDPKQIEEKPKKKEMVETKKEVEKEPEEKRYTLKSNSVGIFYRGKAKLAPPLVKLNSVVKKGEQVGIIDCMGIVEKVVSPVAGKVVEVLIDNHKPVEYAQPLFVIEKE